MLENALVCKKIGGFINGDFCYITDDYLKQADVECTSLQLNGRRLPIAKTNVMLCEMPLAELSLMPEYTFKMLERMELERINPPTKPIGFVTTDKKKPAQVSISTTEHRLLTEENLKEAIQRTLGQQEKFRAEVGDNWFPCGFVNLHIDGRDPLVAFMKKYGQRKNDPKDYKYNQLEIWKDYRGGYTLHFRYPQRDAMECQSMNFANKMYSELQKELALLGIRANIESRVD